MRGDRKAKTLILDIREKCDYYLSYVRSYNECAHTDRILESIVKLSKDLESVHKNRFSSKEQNNKSIER